MRNFSQQSLYIAKLRLVELDPSNVEVKNSMLATVYLVKMHTEEELLHKKQMGNRLMSA